MEVPGGWISDRGAFLLKEDVGFGLWLVQDVYADPCEWSGSEVDPPVGTSVDDLVGALVRHRDTTSPSDVSVAGYHGKRLEIAVPGDIDLADCQRGEFRSWTDPRLPGAGRYHQGPGQVDELYIVDVAGTVLVIDAGYFPDSSPEAVTEVREMIESIQIEVAD